MTRILEQPPSEALADLHAGLGPTLAAVPHIEQYAGLWAMHEPQMRALADWVNRTDVLEHVAHHGADRLAAEAEAKRSQDNGDQDDSAGPAYLRTADGIAVIEIVGTLTKYGSSLSALRQGTIGLRRAVRQAVVDPDVVGIMLRVDSPGGAVAGTGDLADDIWAAGKSKPTAAYIEDLGASGAYYLASQARRLTANRSAIVGSIGVFGVVADWSKFYGEAGVKVHVIRSGAFKAAGVRGTEITDDQLAEWQRGVDALAEQFVIAIARGRPVTKKQAEALADGRVHIGAEAIKLGLIDGVESFDQAVAALRKQVKQARAGGPTAATTEPSGTRAADQDMEIQQMADKEKETAAAAPTESAKTEVRPATLGEIKAGCPGADSDWLCSQLEANATLEQATRAWTAELAKRNAAQAAELEKLKVAQAESAKAAAAAADGLDPTQTGPRRRTADGGDGGTAAEQWNAEIEAKVKAGIPRQRAVSQLAKERPELREQMVAEANERNK